MKCNPITILALIFFASLLLASCKEDCDPASTANAGPDQTLNGIMNTTLDAEEPTSGHGVWTIVSGNGGNISSTTTATSGFTGVLGVVYVLKWTVSGCPISEDEVQIELIDCQPASTANAGSDQDITGNSTTLAATAPITGTGTWSIVSGDGGVVTNVNSPTSDFSGQVGKTYLLKWVISGCPDSEDEVQIKFNNNPALLTVDKTSAINGEIITITGVNFTANYDGMSQVKAVNLANSNEVFLPILSWTETQIIASMIGAGGGALGNYKLYYGRRPDSNTPVFHESNLTVELTSASNKFFTSSSFASTNIQVSNPASNTVALGVKNGSANVADYTVKLIQYNSETGISTESSVSVFNFTVDGYNDTMDKIDFTFPNNLPIPGTYRVKITYNNSTLIGGWQQSLFVN
jgi:hypothetical protein